MKKIVLTLAFAAGFTFVQAQNDLAIDLTSPSAGTTLGPGLAFDFDVTISNLGTQAVTSSDTLIYYPVLNNSLLYTTQNGQQVPILFQITGVTMNTSNTESRSISFGGLSISNASAMNIDFCGGVVAFGPNWNGVTETDTTNNFDCQTVAYDPNGGSVGLAENVIFSEGSIQVLDGSYSDGKVFYLNVYNLSSPTVAVSFVDLTGRTIFKQVVSANGKEAHSEISLANLPKGVLLSVVEVDGQQINAKKFIVK